MAARGSSASPSCGPQPALAGEDRFFQTAVLRLRVSAGGFPPRVVAHSENERRIAELIDGRQLTLLAAWGELIETRPYLFQMLEVIVPVTDASGCNWVSLGDFLKSGHPRHPSRASYDWPLQSFDVGNYRRAVRA